MPHALSPYDKKLAPSFHELFNPATHAMIQMPKLESRGNRPLKMSFEDHLKALVYFHLQEHTSAQHLLQILEEDDFARNEIAPDGGIQKSSFSEATNSRGLEQFMYVFAHLQEQAKNILPNRCPELGNLVGIPTSVFIFHQ